MKIFLALLCFIACSSALIAHRSSAKSSARKLSSVTLSGNSTLSDQDLQFIFKPYLGKTLSVADQNAITTKIDNYYLNEGYIFSCVLESKYKGSILHIKILEGSIRNVILYDKLRDNKLIQKYAEIIKAIRPFNTKKAQHTLELIARIPGILGNEVTLVPRLVNTSDNPDKIKPEVVDVIVMPSGYESVQARLLFSNRHKFDYKNIDLYRQEDLTGHNIVADSYAAINNPLDMGDRLSAFLSSSWNKRSNILSSSYTIPINSVGTSIKASMLHSVSKLHGSSKSNSVTLGASHALFLNSEHSLDIGSELVLSDGKSNLIADNVPTASKRNKKSSLKAVLSGIYKVKNLLFSSHSYQLDFNQSLTSKENNLKKKFSKLVLTGKSTLPLLKDALKFSLYTKGQLNTSNYLPEQELFGLGEFRGGRGFKAAEIYGEKGLSVAAELSLSHYFKDSTLAGCTNYIYLDSGWTKYSRTKTDQDNAITSTGIGTHLSLSDSATLTFELSKPLRNTSKSLLKTSNRAKFFTGFEYYFRY